MNCTECKELMVAYVEGLLDESPKRTVAEHLKNCPACRAEAEDFTGLYDRLIRNGGALAHSASPAGDGLGGSAQSDLENNVMNKVVREQNIRLKAAQRATEALKTRRTIMKSPISKIAAVAAVISIATVISLNPFGSSVTFADVVKPILNAKTIICDLIIGLDDSNPVSHEIIVDSRIRRSMSNMPNMVMILDLDGGKMLALDTASKTATYVDIQGELQSRTQAYVNFLRETIRQLKENADIKELGEQVIDGQKAVGFTARGPNTTMTIWADPKTDQPIRIEAQLGQEFTFIMKNFELDVPVEESLVSMDVPAGYQLQDAQFSLADADEQDFVESLRVWAKVLGDGTFPDAIGTESAMKQMPQLGQRMMALNLSEEQATQMGIAFGKGMLFHQIIDTRGDDWKYVGSGVKLGDASKPVFWYRPQGAENYRVIYGDLTVKDVAPENLPK